MSIYIQLISNMTRWNLGELRRQTTPSLFYDASDWGFLDVHRDNDRTFVGGIQWAKGACWQKVEFRIPLSSRPKHTKTLETYILRQEWWWRQRRHTRYLGWQVRGRGLNTELQSKQKAFDVSDVSSSSVGLDITWSDEIVMNPWKGWYFIMNIAAPRGTCYRFLLWICLRRRGSLDFASHKKMDPVCPGW